MIPLSNKGYLTFDRRIGKPLLAADNKTCLDRIFDHFQCLFLSFTLADASGQVRALDHPGTRFILPKLHVKSPFHT